MNRHQALQGRLTAIEAALQLSPCHARRQLSDPASRRDAADDPVSPVLQALLAEVLPGALVLDWRQAGGGHFGRMAADGLVYRFRVDGDGVGYRPAWEGVQQRGWKIRSDSFLELRASAARMDYRLGIGATAGQKRRCSAGYSCGAACISLQKECRIAPSSAIGKARLRRLQQLAAAGDKGAEVTASQVAAARGVAAGERQKERTTRRVNMMLARPEIAEYLRTGKLPEVASASTEPGTVRNMKPGEIAFDPGRFQYKINATEGTGEVGSLAGVRRWDPNLAGVMSVWTDPVDRKVYVVNGHNRLSLANRLGAEEVTVRFLNAKTATEARAIGAMQNIAEGAGTPMDAAKFFRDTGIRSQADVEAKGLPLRSGQAEKGLKLSRLPAEVFNAVVQGDLSVNRGAIIGGSGLDEAKQREVFKMVSARKGIADQTLLELVEHAAASVQRTQTTFDLFGESQEAKDNLLTRARLAAGLKSKISREKRLFGSVSKVKAASTLAEKAGNVINQEQSAKVAGEASEALAVFERLKSLSGPISSALNRAADRVEGGESETRVRQDLERDVFAAVEQELVSLGLRKRPRADSLQQRIDALRRKCSTGYSCGNTCISLRKECRSTPGSALGKERLTRLLALAAGAPSAQRGIGTVKAMEAADLAGGITDRRGQQAAQLRGARAQQKPAETPTLDHEIKRLQQLQKAHEESAGRSGHHPGSVAREVIAGLQTLNNSSDYGSKKPGKPLRWNIHGKNYEIPDSKLQGLSPREVSALIYTKVSGYKPGPGQAFGSWFAVPVAGASQLRGARAQPAAAKTAPDTFTSDEAIALQVMANKKLRSDRARNAEMLRLGVDPQTDLLSLVHTAREKLGGKDWWKPESGWQDKLKRFAAAAADPGNAVLTNLGRQDPDQAPAARPQGLNAQDVTTSSQQAAFARQQQQAAKAAGDERGAQAWRKEERTVERNRLTSALATTKQSQRSLFGVTEYDQTMPLFPQPAAAAGPRQTPKISDVLRATTEQLKAADARQMGKIAENLFEAGWTIDRRTRYRGMSKDQAREQFKVEFMQKMQQQAASPEAAANSAAMRQRAGASGSVAGAMKSILKDMKAQDQRLEDLQRQSIDLRIQAEEQFGAQGGADPNLGGGRPRRSLGGRRRRDAAADILEARIEALRMQCTPVAR